MNTQITLRKVNHIAILEARGKLVFGTGTQAIRSAVKELLDCGSTSVVLNLEAVTYLDSSVLGEVIAAYTALEAAGGRLKLVNSRRVQDILITAKLTMIFDLFDDVASAIHSFAPPLATATRPHLAA